MRLTERMAEAERRSGVLEAERAWDAAYEARHTDREGLEAATAAVRAARESYRAIERELRAQGRR